jgi:O-antigen/teichoic acid export membrane protein
VWLSATTYWSFRFLSIKDASVMTIANSIVTLIAVLDMGVPAAYVTRVAAGGPPAGPRAVAAWLLRRLGGLGLIACAATIFACRILTIGSGLSNRSVAVIVFAITSSVLTVVLSPYDRVLYARQSFRSLDRAFLIGFGVPAVAVGGAYLLPTATSAWLFLIAVYSAPIFARLICVRASSDDVAPAARFTYRQLPDAPDFFKVAILGTLAFSIDSLVALVVIGHQAAVDVAIAARLFAPVMLLGTVITQSVWPTIARDRARDHRSLRPFYRAATRKVVAATIVATVVLVLASPWVAKILTKGGSRPSWHLLGLTAVWTSISCWGNLLGQVHAGASDTRWVVSIGAMMTGPNVLLSALFGHLIGPGGVVLGSIASYMPFFVASLIRIPRILTPAVAVGATHVSSSAP